VSVTFIAFAPTFLGGPAVVKAKGSEMVRMRYGMAVRIGDNRSYSGHFGEDVENSLQLLSAD
jgi:hypothetical protein